MLTTLPLKGFVPGNHPLSSVAPYHSTFQIGDLDLPALGINRELSTWLPIQSLLFVFCGGTFFYLKFQSVSLYCPKKMYYFVNL